MSKSSVEDEQLDAAEKARNGVEKDQEAGPLGFCEPGTLCFLNIRYRIPCGTAGKVEILRGISGFCRGGRLLALMGASGENTL